MMRRNHYVRERIENKQHALIWITNEAQIADMGTKILGRILLDPFKELVLVKVPELIRKFRRGVGIHTFREFF
jgi:hypothetical protein